MILKQGFVWCQMQCISQNSLGFPVQMTIPGFQNGSVCFNALLTPFPWAVVTGLVGSVKGPMHDHRKVKDLQVQQQFLAVGSLFFPKNSPKKSPAEYNMERTNLLKTFKKKKKK